MTSFGFRIFCVAFLALTGTAWADTVSTFKLDNGMDVVVIEDHRAPVVVHMVWYRIGAADESPGHSGIAHFLEHLMFQGTKDVAPGELSKIVAAQGGSDNAFTTQDYTAYFQRVAADRLDLVMKLVCCNGQAVAKLSDSPGKTICSDETFLAYLRQQFKHFEPGT